MSKKLKTFRLNEGDIAILEQYKPYYGSETEVIRAALRALQVLDKEGRLPEKKYVVEK